MLECHEVSHVEHRHALIDCQGLGRRSLFGQNDGYWHTYILCPISFKASMITISSGSDDHVGRRTGKKIRR